MMTRYMSLLPALLVSAVPTTGLALEKVGQEVFNKHCTHCHAPGLNHPGTLQLSVTRGEALSVLEQRRDLSPDYIKYIVRHGLKTMPAFKPTTITNKELDALASHLGK
jgi:mono/diheme cytochrome c family protein